MKHKQHENRKSFKNWSLPNQRTDSFTSKSSLIATRNNPKRGYARMGTSQFSLGTATILHKPMGAKAQKILPYNYKPQVKNPSRRDKHRLSLVNKSPRKRNEN